MSKVTLKPGDYVSTEGMTEDQYHAVASAFMEAGANDGAWESQIRMSCFGWCHDPSHLGLLFQSERSSQKEFSRHLTIDQVLGTQPEWNGEGLPPVDTECEVECGLNDYEPCKILAHHDGRAVFVLHFSGAVHASKYGFRPLRTTEERERDEVAQDLIDNQLACTMDYAKVMAGQLLEAGYRKKFEELKRGDVVEIMDNVPDTHRFKTGDHVTVEDPQGVNVGNHAPKCYGLGATWWVNRKNLRIVERA